MSVIVTEFSSGRHCLGRRQKLKEGTNDGRKGWIKGHEGYITPGNTGGS